MTRLRTDLLTADEIHQIHSQSIRILEEIGVKFESSFSLNLLEASGAIIDHHNMVAKIPESLIKDTLRSISKEFHLVGRGHGAPIHLTSQDTHFATGDALNLMDLSGAVRPARLEDAESFTRFADALKSVHVVYVIDANVEPSIISDRYRYFIGFTQTSKPITAWIKSPKGARDIIEMASLLAGGEKELARNPPFYYGYNATSPLKWAQDDLESFKILTSNGIPVSVQSSPIVGLTAPGALAGAISLANAEILSGMAINYLYRKDAKCLYCMGLSYSMDPRTGKAVTASPEAMLIAAAGAQMARYYGIPSMSWIRSDSKVLDAQAGLEKALLMFTHACFGNNLIWGIGSLELEMTASFEQAIVDDELVGLITRLIKGVNVDQKTLAFDSIKRAGIEGNYLSDPNWRKDWIKDQFIPSLIDRSDRRVWQAGGAKDLAIRAREKAKQIVQEHNPEPLDKELIIGLQEIVSRARRDASD